MRGVGVLLLALALIVVLWFVARPDRPPDVPPMVRDGAAMAREGAHLEAQDPRGHSRAGPRASEARGEEPLLVGLLRQQETREPLPWYHLEVHAPGRSFALSTDAQGRFSAPCPPGDLRIDFHDTPRRPNAVRPGLAAATVLQVRTATPTARVQHVDGTTRHELQVSSGPTFLLDVERPVGPVLADLRASMRLIRASASGIFDATWASVRDDGGREWVRFGPDVWGHVNGPWGVTLRTGDDGWMSGEALTGRGHGLFPDPLRLRLLPRGRLRVRALREGAPETWHVLPHLAPVGRPPYEVRDDVAFARHGEARMEAPSTWLFSGLEGGRYTLIFFTQRHERYRAEVEVVMGEVTEHAAHLRRLPVGGEVSGSLVTETGTETPARRVTLVSQDGERQFDAAVDWREAGGRKVGHFVFENIPADRYRLAPLARTLHAWQPEGIPVDPPATGIEFLCRDGGEHAPIGFLVTDVATGETLDLLRLSLRRLADPPDEAKHSDLTSGQPIHVRFPLEAPVEWIVSRVGYRSALGDASAFGERRDTSHGEGRFARVTLEREE